MTKRLPIGFTMATRARPVEGLGRDGLGMVRAAYVMRCSRDCAVLHIGSGKPNHTNRRPSSTVFSGVAAA